MSGGISLIKIKGEQDKDLTGSPQLNFIKNAYLQYNKPSTEKIKVEFSSNINFNKKISCILPDKADYLSKIYLCFTLPALTPVDGTYASWTNSIGHAIIDYIDLEIGGRLIDRHYGLFMEIWEELTGKDANYNNMIGKTSNINSLHTTSTYITYYSVPLRFWFCENLENAFPMYSLFYHKIKIHIKLKNFNECINYDGNTEPLPVSIIDAYLMCDYIYTMYKPLKVQKTSILISQLQYKQNSGEEVNHTSNVFKTNLPFNHPVKELLWVFIEKASIENNDPFNFSKRNLDLTIPNQPLMRNVTFYLDGKEYSKTYDERIYRSLNTYKYHKNTTDRFIYTLPFSEYPEQHQPSGSLNFSCIDYFLMTGSMNSPIDESYLYIFALNYNWLDIQEGICVLRYLS